MRRRLSPLAAALGSAAAVLLGALAADQWFQHGIEVTWRALHEDRVVEVDRTVEHRVAFPNQHRALGRYVQGWNFDAWGVPSHMPPLDARIRARITVPPGEPLLLRAESPNETDLLVDNLRANEPVPPGTHDLTVYWHGPLQPPGTVHWTRILPASLELTWGTDEESLEPVPPDAVSLPADTADPARAALWIGAVLLALLVGGAVFFAVGARSPASARRRAAALAGALLVLFAIGLRVYDYDVMPEFRENMDELFATWNGWQLLEDGTTRGWTLWPTRYTGWAEVERVEYFRERPISVVTPYFEHPPLFHVLVGAAAHAGGAKEYLHARLSDTRPVPIALGVLTLVLVLLVSRRLDARGPAPLLAGLLYATVPLIVIMNRVAKEEALLAPLAAGSILFFLRWRDDGERLRDLLLAAVLAGLCPLAKVPGLVFVPVLVFLVAQTGRWRAAAAAAAVALGVAALLLVYAAAVDWNAFWFVTRDQATIRSSSWDQFVPFFYDALINHNRVGRGWLVFLWIAFVAAALARSRNGMAALALPVVGYLVAMGLPSGSWHYGWYLLPVYPFLCIGAGSFLADLWEEPELLRGALFVLLPVAYAMTFLHDPEWVRSPWSNETMRRWVGAFVIAFLLPYGLVQLRRTRLSLLLARAGTAAALALVVALNAFFVIQYEALYETHHAQDDLTLCKTCEERGVTAPSPESGRGGSE